MSASPRPSIAIFLDSPDENWRAMDLCGEMLVREWKGTFRAQVEPVPFATDLPRWGRRLRGSGSQRAFNFDRAIGRFIVYPTLAVQQRTKFDFFHVVDHTYAQLVHVLPPGRTGVYCHDLDAFRSLLPETRQPRKAWFRAMQWVTLAGLRSAAVVFYSTTTVRDEIERTEIVPSARLVQAPLGISPEFDAIERDDDGADRFLAPLEGRPFLLHVGSAATRKRLDVLFETFARLRARHPELRLVQHGGALSEQQLAHVERCGIREVFVQPTAAARIDRRVLAGFYRRAKAVLVTSSSEGFGLPVIEALACGAPVFASDIPVLREVGEGAAVYCRMGDPEAWAATLDRFLDGDLLPPPRAARLARAATYTWANHARTILDAYRNLGDLECAAVPAHRSVVMSESQPGGRLTVCGIAGILGVRRELAEPALARMRAAIDHRGPDDRETVFVDSKRGTHPLGLAHTRLAIIDTSSAGRQPMQDSGGAWITFNGEIYNFAKVRSDLERAGHPCRGRTDTEVILRGHAAWGPDVVKRLRGMFAWALADPAEGTVWLCRDRLGIKPLYFARPPDGGLLFASEVRALVAAGPALMPARVSAAAVESFLAQGMVCGYESIVDGVKQLPPGTSLMVDWDGRERATHRYWQLPFDQGPAVWTSRPDAVEQLGSTLREAVDCHLIADVPLGLFLSGGVDSSAVATIATEVSSAAAVRTLAMGFDQRQFDESEEAAKIAFELGTEHRNVVLTGEEMLSDIDEVFRAMDQPTVDGFNTYFVSRAARRAGLTVALSGLGGDELFGGYATFRDVPRAVTMARMAQRLMGGRHAGDGEPAPHPLKPPVGGRGALKFAEMLSRTPSLESMYLLRRELFLAAERRSLHGLPRESNGESGVPAWELEDLAGLSSRADVANTVSAFELAHYLRYMLLRDADVFSMAVGLELRVPLLDHAFVEAAVPLPGRWKRNDGRSKPLLLDAVGPRLPSWVGTQRKRGFTFPWRAWLMGPLQDRAHRALSNHEVWRMVGIDEGKPEEMWFRFLGDDARVGASQIMALWVLAEYAQKLSLSSPR